MPQTDAEKAASKRIGSIDTESLVDELITRMVDLPEDEARAFKIKVMKCAGYSVRPSYHKPEQKPERRNTLFGNRTEVEEESDDSGLFE